MSDLSELKVAGPTMIAFTAPFWQAAAEGRLLIQRCGGCGRGVFYPREICPHCWSAALGWEEASGRGRLASFSTVWRAGHPGWQPAAPYHVGLVTLAEGPRMMSHVLEAGGPPRLGAALRFRPVNIGGRVLPCFETVEGEPE